MFYLDLNSLFPFFDDNFAKETTVRVNTVKIFYGFKLNGFDKETVAGQNLELRRSMEQNTCMNIKVNWMFYSRPMIRPYAFSFNVGSFQVRT